MRGRGQHDVLVETGTGDQKISYKLTVTCDGDSKYKVHQELTQGGKTSSTDTEQNMASGKCDQASIDDLKKQLCPNNDEELEVIMKTQLVVWVKSHMPARRLAPRA